MKGGIAAIIDAILQIDFSKLKSGIKLYFTYDEEIDFSGIKELVNINCGFPEIMLFGEATNNEILVGSKGLLEYNLNFIGRKAHSSNPKKGISANFNAVKFVSELKDFYEIAIKIFKEEKYEIPYTTMNVGLINGGSAINSIPASCNVKIDFRIANQEHIELINSKVKELSKKYMCEVEILNCIEPFLDKSYLRENLKTANFITEASFIKKTNRIILGPGPVTAHEVNEYITEESYKKLINQYKNLILETCSK